jgi:hypothetical protein
LANGTSFAFSFAVAKNRRKENTMSKKHKGGGAPVPKGNQSYFGPAKPIEEENAAAAEGEPASRQDTKRRLGNFQTAGEHAIEQPGGKQGADR